MDTIKIDGVWAIVTYEDGTLALLVESDRGLLSTRDGRQWNPWGYFDSWKKLEESYPELKKTLDNSVKTG